jgi:hypothetical protein
MKSEHFIYMYFVLVLLSTTQFDVMGHILGLTAWFYGFKVNIRHVGKGFQAGLGILNI